MVLQISPRASECEKLCNGRAASVSGEAVVWQAVCNHTQSQRLGVRDSKRHVVYNGLDIERFRHVAPREKTRQSLGLDPAARVFITVANMHFPFKGHGELLDAWCRHAPAHPGDVLLLVGDGKLRGALEGQAHDAGLTKRTLFLGSRSDVADLLAASDVYVSPSWFEGCSNSILEAQLSGLPIIATAVGGTPEFVQDGPFGRLVPPRRSQELAVALAGDLQPLPLDIVKSGFLCKISRPSSRPLPSLQSAAPC